MPEKIILFIGRKHTNSSVRLRHYDYFQQWKNSGYTPILVTLNKNPVDLLKLLYLVKKSKIVIIIRKTMKPPILFLIRKLAKNIIFDFDDAIFAKSNGQDSSRRYQRFIRMMKNTDRVWAGNNYLKAVAQKYISPDKITVMATALDYKKYNIDSAKPKTYFDLVWIGSKSTGKYLEAVFPILANISAKIPHLRLKIIADFQASYPGLNIINIPWSLQEEAQHLTSSHAGIAPMVDDPWTKGKCAFKVIQYLASGLPVLSSPVGMNQQLIVGGVTGYLVVTEQEWCEAINSLYQDSLLRAKMGVNARQLVAASFDAVSNYKKMLNDCQELLARTNVGKGYR